VKGTVFTVLDSLLPANTERPGNGEVSGFFVDAGGVNHGFLLNGTTDMTLDFPGATFTQALGLNDSGMVDGVYMAGDATHGFVYNIATNAYQSFDDPNGIGTTTSNGINDKGQLVGF